LAKLRGRGLRLINSLQPTGTTGTGKQTGGRYLKSKAAENSTQKVRKEKHNPRNRGH